MKQRLSKLAASLIFVFVTALSLGPANAKADSCLGGCPHAFRTPIVRSMGEGVVLPPPVLRFKAIANPVRVIKQKIG